MKAPVSAFPSCPWPPVKYHNYKLWDLEASPKINVLMCIHVQFFSIFPVYLSFITSFPFSHFVQTSVLWFPFLFSFPAHPSLLLSTNFYISFCCFFHVTFPSYLSLNFFPSFPVHICLLPLFPFLFTATVPPFLFFNCLHITLFLSFWLI